jgi:hypothetical protein
VRRRTESFNGAGNTFTDFYMVDRPIRALFGGRLEETGMTAIAAQWVTTGGLGPA